MKKKRGKKTIIDYCLGKIRRLILQITEVCMLYLFKVAFHFIDFHVIDDISVSTINVFGDE